MKFNLFLVAALSLLIASCTIGVPKNYNFDTSSKYGLVVVGISTYPNSTRSSRFNGLLVPNALRDVSFSLAPLDDLGRALLFQNERIDHLSSNRKPYYVLNLKPGSWVVQSVTRTSGFDRHISCFSKGTYKFEVVAGEIRYVGDLIYFRDGEGGGKLEFGGFSSDEDVAAVLKGYKNIAGSPSRAEFEAISFENSNDLRC